MSGAITPPPGAGAAPATPGGGPPGAGAGGPTPPIGASPATGPSQNLGATAQGNQIVAALLQGMVLAMTKLPPGTPIAQAISEAHTKIGKLAGPDSASPAGVSNAFKGMAMQNGKMAPQMGAMAAQAGGGAPPPGAGAPKPPMMG